MQTEDTKLIFVMNVSVLHFFKLRLQNVSNCTDLVSTFKFFRGGGGGEGRGAACPRTPPPPPPPPLEISSFFSLGLQALQIMCESLMELLVV